MERRYQYLPGNTFRLHASLSALTLSPDGQFLAAGINRLLRIWDLESEDLPTPYIEYYAHEKAFVTTLLWTGIGLFSAYSSGEIALLSLDEDEEGGKLCHCHGFQASMDSVNHLALDEATLTFAVAGRDTITIWKPDCKDSKWDRYCSLPQPRGVPLRDVAGVTSLAWLPGCGGSLQLLVSYSRHGILIWDIEKKEQIRSFSTGPVPHGFLSPDGLHFALSTELNVFDLFDIKKQAYIHSFVDMANGLPETGIPVRHPLTFVHEGRCLLGGGEGKIKMWRLDTKDCIVTIELESPHQIQFLTAHTGSQSRFFRIAAGYNTGVVTIWTADVSDLIGDHNVASLSEAHHLNGGARTIVTFLIMVILGLTFAYSTAA